MPATEVMPATDARYCARVQYVDGHVEEISNVDPSILEYLFDELNYDKRDHGLYVYRTDGATLLSKDCHEGVLRFDVVRVEAKT